MSKNSKEIATTKIKEKLVSLNKEKGLNLEFIKFKEENWKGAKEAIVIIKCNIHNRLIETKYKQVVYKDNKDIIVCPDCLKDKTGNVKRKFSSNEEALAAILDKIESLKPKRQFEFLGFKDKNVCSQNSRIYIKCNIHNEIRCTTISGFLKSKDGGCRHCAGDSATHPNMLSNEQIFKKLVSKFGNYYDFSPILTEEELGGMNGKRKITFICPQHGIKTLNLSSLMEKDNNIPCSECSLEFYKNQDKENCIKDLQAAINWRNVTYGLNYEFIGFDREYVNKNKLFALIRCITHNTIFKVKPRLFIEGHTITKCEQCDLNRYKYEDACYKVLTSKGLKVIRQHPVKCYDDILNKYRTLNVDFYLPDLNIIIEYDGSQHYKLNPKFHKNLENYRDQVRRDIIKNQFCKNNNIPLLRITYQDNKRIDEIITTFIETGENIAKKLTPKEYPDT